MRIDKMFKNDPRCSNALIHSLTNPSTGVTCLTENGEEDDASNRQRGCDRSFTTFCPRPTVRASSRTLDAIDCIECDTCHFVSFCSLKCKANGWLFHSVECHVTARQRPIRNLTRLIARVLVRLHETNFSMNVGWGGSVPDWNRLDEPSELIWGHKRDWARLMDHYDDIVHDADAMQVFGIILEELELIFDGSMSELTDCSSLTELTTDNNRKNCSLVGRRLYDLADVETLLRIYGRILVNSFSIPDTGADNAADRLHSIQQIARGVYLGPSIFDHSCRPDAMFLFRGVDLYIVALRDLSIDDINTVRICYIDELEMRDDRRKLLSDAFYFECQCERCVLSPLGDENLTGPVRHLCAQIDDFHGTTKSEFILAKLGQSSRIRAMFHCPARASNCDLRKLIADDRATPLADTILDQIKQSGVNVCENEFSENSLANVKIAEFIACYQLNARIMDRLVAFYRKYYGDSHPRLLNKLNQFVGVLVQSIARIYLDGRPGQRVQLEYQLTLCARLIKQANAIRTLFDTSICDFLDCQTVNGASDARECLSVTTTKSTLSSYRNLLDDRKWVVHRTRHR